MPGFVFRSLAPAGSITIPAGSSGSTSVPLSVRNVNICITGGTGNPGNPGNVGTGGNGGTAGNPGNPGNAGNPGTGGNGGTAEIGRAHV